MYCGHCEAAGEAVSARWSLARRARGDMLTVPHPAALAQGGLGRGATGSAPWDVPRALIWQPPAAGGPGLPAAGPAPSAAAAAAAAMANAAAAAAVGSAPSAAPARGGGAGAAAASEGDDSPERPEAPETESESSGPEGTGGGSAGTATGSAGAAGAAEALPGAAPGAAAVARFTEGDLEAVASLVGLQTIARTAPPEPPQRLFLFEQLTRLDRRALC